jgi:hypothetical protein
MTGPRSATVQPHRTRARPLLPFLAAIMLSSLACSEQPAVTEPSNTGVTPSVRLHPYLRTSQGAVDPASVRFYRSSALVTLGTANITSGGRVLLLADEDGASTSALANSIVDAGFVVTIRPAPEYTWDGTNPSLDGYDLIIHLNGNTVSDGQMLSPAAQSVLVDFVRAGGGFIGSQWNSYEVWNTQEMTGEPAVMQDLVLAGFPGPAEENCPSCLVTYSAVLEQQGHPLLAGIPSEFTFEADGHLGGPQVEFGTEPSTVIMALPSGTPGVLVRNLGQGKVVNFSFAPNYSLAGSGHTLQDPNVQQLYVNAVRWAIDGSAQPPTKSPATLTLGYPVTTFDGTAKAVSVTTSPVGLSGVVVAYSQNGLAVDGPTSAGVYQVVATLDNADYEAPQANGTLTILPAEPVIQWTPSPVTEGAPLGSAQLNATARGIDGRAVAGEFFYLPGEGTILPLGAQPVSVEFQPLDRNYKNVIASVTITVVQPAGRLKFNGFFKPLFNLPLVNAVAAGRAVPVKFSVEGAIDSRVLKSGSPTSVQVQCNPASTSKVVSDTGDEVNSVLFNSGTSYTYIWKTNPLWGGSCRKLIVTLVDGSQHSAVFRFSKEQKAKAEKTPKQSKNPKFGPK